MNLWPQISGNVGKTPNMCFCCGQDNPVGLKLKFTYENSIARAEFTPDTVHQGWTDVVHGGIICCCLDEAMTYATYFEHINCITARLEVRIRQMLPVGQPVVLTSSITKRTRKLLETKAEMAFKDGTVVAESTATMYIVSRKNGETDGK